jgi:hypothetical protein
LKRLRIQPIGTPFSEVLGEMRVDFNSMIEDSNYTSSVHSFLGVWYEVNRRFPKNEAEFNAALKIGPAENLHGSFAVDSAEIDATLRRPDQGDPLGSAGGSVIYPGRTRAGYLREECLLREPAKRGRVP